jgi:hypothetical protein
VTGTADTVNALLESVPRWPAARGGGRLRELREPRRKGLRQLLRLRSVRGKSAYSTLIAAVPPGASHGLPSQNREGKSIFFTVLKSGETLLQPKDMIRQCPALLDDYLILA